MKTSQELQKRIFIRGKKGFRPDARAVDSDPYKRGKRVRRRMEPGIIVETPLRVEAFRSRTRIKPLGNEEPQEGSLHSITLALSATAVASINLSGFA